MMQKIKITCSSLTTLAEEVSSLGDELNTKCLEFEELLDSLNLNKIWCGYGEVAYNTLSKDKYLSALKKVNEAVFDYSTFLQKASQAKSSLESDMSSQEITIY